MKIVIITNYFYPEIGAASKRLFELAKGLRTMGHNIEIICPMPNYPKGEIFPEYNRKFFVKEELNSIIIRRYWILASVSKNPIARFWSMFSFAFNIIFEIPHLIRKKNDIILVQTPPLLVSFIAILISKLFLKGKIVLNISDLWPLSAVELGALKTQSLIFKILHQIEKFNYKNCNAILGQSQEILDHVSEFVFKKKFLYRNLPNSIPAKPLSKSPSGKFKIIYAGLLGTAQGIYEIITSLNFQILGAELYIFGDGNEREKIVQYLKTTPSKGIYYQGIKPHKELISSMHLYEAALVPLTHRIKGAVPSKIFELASVGVPVLFLGGGEGEKIVKKYNLGLTSKPNDLEGLKKNIKHLIAMPVNDYIKIKQSCINTAKSEFDFTTQMIKLNFFLENQL